MGEQVIIIVLTVLISNLATWFLTRYKGLQKFEKAIKGNILQIIEHENIIVKALANSNGFGDAFTQAYECELEKKKFELKVI